MDIQSRWLAAAALVGATSLALAWPSGPIRVDPGPPVTFVLAAPPATQTATPDGWVSRVTRYTTPNSHGEP